MNKVYILVPLIGCILFGAYYWNFNKKHVADIEAKLKAEREALIEQNKKDAEARMAAYDDAVKAQAIRKAEREERERIEDEKKKARQDLEDQRERAFNDLKRARELVARLKKEVTGVEEEVAKIQGERKTLTDEQTFLRNYVRQAESNQKYYYDLLDKIAAAEKAAAEAAAAAAAAKKS